MVEIILASASPRRQELLKKIVDDFICIAPDVDETFDETLEPKKISEYLATIKCAAVAEKYPDSLVIGCDTLVYYKDRIMGKPTDRSDAKNMLMSLSGNIHHVITGVCMIYRDKTYIIHSQTDVRFKNLSENEIEKYLDSDEPYDKAGAYGIQGYGNFFVEAYYGDYFNVVGLPVDDTRQLLMQVTNGFM